jgi:hypothetical protein
MTPALHRLQLVSPGFGRGLDGFRHRIPAELQSTGIAELDALLRGGFPRGSLIELCGTSSSGRTSVSFSLLAQATARQEACAFVDVSDSLDPMSLAAAGADLARVLWIRCGNAAAGVPSKKNCSLPQQQTPSSSATARGKVKRGMPSWTHPRDQIRGVENAIPLVMGHANRSKKYSLQVNATTPAPASPNSSPQLTLPPGSAPQNNGSGFLRQSSGKNKPWKTLEQALKVTDLLLHAGGWGVVVFDLGNISWADARRIELSTWFRFRRAIENTSTILLLLGEDPCAKSCSSVVLRCERKSESWSSASAPGHSSQLPTLQGFEMEGQILSSRIGLPLMDSAQWIAKSLWSNSF